MAQYMVSVWHDDDYELDFSSEDAQRRVAQVGRFNADLIEQDALVFGAGLHPRSTAMVMEPRDGEIVTIAGPYGAAKEHIGGFWIIEAADLDAAREWARRAANACEGPVELRQLQGE